MNYLVVRTRRRRVLRWGRQLDASYAIDWVVRSRRLRNAHPFRWSWKLSRGLHTSVGKIRTMPNPSPLRRSQRHCMVERRIKAAKFPTVKNLDSFDFLALPSLNRMAVLDLARSREQGRAAKVRGVTSSSTQGISGSASMAVSGTSARTSSAATSSSAIPASRSPARGGGALAGSDFNVSRVHPSHRDYLASRQVSDDAKRSTRSALDFHRQCNNKTPGSRQRTHIGDIFKCWNIIRHQLHMSSEVFGLAVVN